MYTAIAPVPLSSFAGDFVVAIAGSDLESIIAAKGSGSSALSKSKLANIINLDIGGGTTNLAFFSNGVALNTTCMDIGGRMIEVKDGNNNQICLYPNHD